MADIDLYQDQGDDNGDDGCGLDDGLDCDEPFGDDNLTPLQKLEKYMESDNVYTRQMVAKSLLDTLRAVGDSEEQTTAVLTAMMKLSDDSDPIVRSELMEQVPNIAMYCHQNRDIFHNAIPVYILPMVVRYLDDANNQVRKTSQAALLVLLEQDLIDKEHIEDQVVSVILELASPDSLDEYRTEAVALMSKMAPQLGKEMTERVFLARFCEMCGDPLFHVRKVCAANFGDFCSVVSQKSAEEQLLSKFFYLCEDGVWGVRKACAECFMAVSCACSPAVRKSELSSLFVNLLCDQSRWVRMAAFQQLGPFISTFADSDVTGMYVQMDGSLVFNPNEDYKKKHMLEQEDQDIVTEVRQDSDNKLCIETSHDPSSPSDSAFTPTDVCDNDTVPMDVDSDSQQGSNDQSRDTSSEQSAISQGADDGNSVSLAQINVEISVEEKRAEHYQGVCNKNLNGNNNDVKSGVEDGGDCDKGADDSPSGSKSSDTEKDQTLPSDSIAPADSGNIDSGEVNQTENQSVSEGSNDVTSSMQTSQSNIEIDELSDTSPDNFNAFNYWRIPLPEVDLDLNNLDPTDPDEAGGRREGEESEDSLSFETLGEGLSRSLEDLTVCDIDTSPSQQGHTSSPGHVTSPGTVVGEMAGMTSGQLSETTMTVIDGHVQDLTGGAGLAYIDSDFSTSPHSSFRDSLLLDDATLAQQQDIVPQSLLENYLGMIDPSRAQTVDTEITKYCAYNLPAVAYTLGRSNWHCIKNLYETLASDMQWKVRRTLAFSIHELAVILGEDITHKDLVPVFDGFLKDLDEVRIGILRHLADFLKLLHPDVRRQYLIKVQDFMNVDNNRNWRFRMELAEQLVLMSELYSANEIKDYLLPLALALAEDKVSEVRVDAYHLVSVMLKRMFGSQDDKLVQYLVNQLIGRFAHSKKWANRQIYTQLCLAIVLEEAVSPLHFARDFLPSLLHLGKDRVPNVRITLAKTLSAYVANEAYSNCDNHPYKEELESAWTNLQNDTDRDVRYFSSPEYSSQEMTHLQTINDSMSDSVSGMWTPYGY